MSRARPPGLTGIRKIGAAIEHALRTGTFDGVHPSTIAYAARRGLARPSDDGTRWVLTPQGRAYRPNAS